MVATTHPLEDDFPVFIPQIIRTTLNEHGLPVHMSRESGSLIYGPHYETRWKHQANWELLRDTSVLHVEIQYDEEQRVIEKTTRKGHESSVLRFRYHNEGSAIRVLRSFGDDAFEHLSTRTLRNGRVASETYPRDDSRPERRFLYRYDAGALRERTFEFPSGQVLKTNVYDASYPWAQSFDALMDTWLG